MKMLLLSLSLFIAHNAFSQSCNERAKYDCRVTVDGDFIALTITDRNTRIEQALNSNDCIRSTDVSLCKKNWITYLTGELNDYRTSGFCY